MTTKQEALMNEFLEAIEEEYRPLFKELAEFAVSYQFNPVRNKTQDFSIDFKNSKLKKTIMKMEVAEQKHDGFGYGERKIPGLRLKFFATKEYSKIFQHAVKSVIEDFDGKYTGCYGCGRCKGNPQGYVYTYPDGKKVFRCGSEQLSIFDFDESNLDEIKQLIQNQIEYWSAQE